MNSYAYYNGNFSRYEDLKIPLSDRALFFGDGVYDAAVGLDGGIYRYDEHYERLAHGARAIGLTMPLGRDELRSVLVELIRISGFPSYFLYFQLSASGGVRRHEREAGCAVNLLATVKPWQIPNTDRAISVCTAEDLRHGFCHIKTLNLLPAAMAATDAASRGFDECIFIKDGYITEGAHSNVFIVKSGVLITPPAYRRALRGITRKTVISLAKSRGIRVDIRDFSYRELISADDVFITATSRMCTRVGRVNGENIRPKCDTFYKISRVLEEEYTDCKQN